MNLLNVPEDKELGWNCHNFVGVATVVDENGKKVTGPVVSIKRINFMKIVSKFGELIFGWNGQYGQWAFRENGGAVMVPYAISPKGELFVAGGYERRLLVNDGELLFTPPGGFAIGNETPEDAAKRATLEEAGIYVDKMIEVGVGTCNRAFWLKNTTDNWPQTFFALPIDWEKLHTVDGKICLPAGNIPEIERLSKLVFVPVMDAMESKDEIATSAFAKTLVAFNKGLLG
ncbi:MAG: NUDIX hydrolase [Candidatus Shapirobacteria bacterium]|nr:NUDIX hydrolase [Candidatus Shapirobacteria bacterium]MDD3002558.1 NUDIX hydrolase [Candidatus Shapirobacteria bacterium]MDD4383073.1 NUDIX hydrolase [Candidatus Shapirobacteria bacterium]